LAAIVDFDEGLLAMIAAPKAVLVSHLLRRSGRQLGD
jgi:hypothetical protein